MSLTNQDLWIDPSEIEQDKIRFSAHLLIGSLCAALLAFIAWAHFAVLDQVTRGEGRVIPSSSTQIIQNLDGGILSNLMVRENDVVEKGQVVAQIENTAAKYNLSELQQRYWAGLATSTRLQAELDGKELKDIVFPEEVVKAVPDVIEAEKALFVARHQQLVSQLATLQQELSQRQHELGEIQTKMDGTNRQLALAQSEHDIMSPLVKSGAVSRVDMLKMERDMAQYQGDLASAKASLPRAQAALEEVNSKIQEAKDSAKATAAQELSKQRLDLATVKESMADAGAKVKRTEVRSPVRGTIKDIKIKTVGGVVQSGAEIMEIVPIEDTLLIEAQIRPSDRGFIAPDQKAVVKISAYDFSIYGGLDAKVEQISADTIENEKKEQFFRVRLRTATNNLIDRKTNKPLAIIPGMTASVDILTGKKTVLEYLLKPLIKASNESLTER